jgi:hypothetical protein
MRGETNILLVYYLWSPCLVIELTTPSSLTTPSPIKVTFTIFNMMINGSRNGAYTSSELQRLRKISKKRKAGTLGLIFFYKKTCLLS